MEIRRRKEEGGLYGRTAIQSKKAVLSYGQLSEICGRMKGLLRDRNLILHICTNTIDAISGYAAFFNCGQVQLLAGEETGREQIEAFMSLYRPRYLYILASRRQEYPDFRVVTCIGTYVLLETGCRVPYRMHDSLALLLTTSGSTGSRKFVRLSYQNVRANAESIAEYLELNREERPVLILPMYYAYGLSIINSHFLVGATLLLSDKSIFQKEFWDYFERNGATSISGTPYMYEMLNKCGFFNRKFPGLRMMTQAGGKLPGQLHKKAARYAEQNGIRFYAMYGQTEATARIAWLPYQWAVRKCGSIGQAIPGGRLVLEDESGKEIREPRTEGELVYYGANVSMGYAEGWKDLEKGDEQQGRLCTGDLGMRDEDGFYYITGRKKRIIKMFGKRVSLDEAEMLIMEQFPEADCCCGGRDDALVVATDEKEEGNRRAMQLFIADRIKVPLVCVTVKYLECLPRTESGKIRYDMI